MAKIELDKYYTPLHIAKYCVEKSKEILGDENITEYLEPSAGNGSFLQFLTDKKCLAFDIAPEHENIIEQDYLKLNLPYKKGRLCIGNPPYGNKNNLSLQFFKKAITQCEFVSFILPISQLNNISSFYEYELIYSEDLKKQFYSGIAVHCCFNIYRRSKFGLLEKEKKTIKYVDIIESRKSRNFNNVESDICINSFGRGIGKIIERCGTHEHETHFIIDDTYHLKQFIIEKIKTINWNKEINNVGNSSLSISQIISILKSHIPELEIITSTKSDLLSTNNLAKTVTIKKQQKY